jgi:1,4-alpha-glucan branching enzyme
MWAHPGKKLLFMGGELGVWDEWSEERALDWSLLRGEEHTGLQQLVRDLNRIYVRCSPLYAADADPFGFEWIDCNDNSQSIIAFMRFTDPPPRDTEPDERDHLVCIANFTPVVRHHYRVGVLRSGRYREVLNTDAHAYGGSGVGNLGVIEASETPCHGLPCSVDLTLPPLAVLWLVPEDSGSVCHVRDKRRA